MSPPWGPSAVEIGELRGLPRGPLPYGGLDLIHGSPADEDEYLISQQDVEPVRHYLGAQLTFFGHTHGGQVRVEILGDDLNVARFYTPYVDGVYREGDASIFVSRGIGTIGIPARIGAPPEVALIHLCRA